MGLLTETIADTFNFWKNYFFKILLYQIFFSIFYVIGVAILFGGIAFGILPFAILPGGLSL